MFVVVLDYVEEADYTALIVLITVLTLLILILLVGMFYTLYVGGKLGASWFTKFITALVSAFFALCMGVAAAGVAILRLFGYEEKDVAGGDDE